MKNRFKYKCADCSSVEVRSKIEFSRRTRPRCSKCGSTFLEPVTKEAKDRMVMGDDAKKIQLTKLGVKPR